MKKNLKLNVFLLLLILNTVSCKKKPSADPIDNLPPITQEGKNTFGCLINGEVFVPKKKRRAIMASLPHQCYYQFIRNDYSPIQGYFFGLSASDFDRQPKYSLNINTSNKAITVGEFDLGPAGVEGTAIGQFWKYPENNMYMLYNIQPKSKGKLIITKFDQINQIVSGTFWFDAVNDQGEKVEVREGRFDMEFTR